MSGDFRSKIQAFEDKQKALVAGDLAMKARAAQTQASRGVRLPTDEMQACRFDRSKNVLLKTIWDEVTAYNRDYRHPSTLSDEAAAHVVAQLDAIYSWAVGYITSKWGKGDPNSTRDKRWVALMNLLDAVNREIEAFGLRRITGTNNFATVSNHARNYWLERMDPEHRPGYVLSNFFATWQSTKPVGSDGKPQPFFEFMQRPENITKMLGDGTYHLNVEGYETGEPLWRKSVHFNENRLLARPTDKIYDTSQRRTEFSKLGWAIFVCSGRIQDASGRFGNHLFSYSHEAGIFHHSTFLGGAPVAAAGEWVVINGKIRVITAKSGHYRPQVEDMSRLLALFPEIPNDAIIRPVLTDIRDHGQVRFHTVRDFRSSGVNAPVVRRARVQAMISPANTAITEFVPGTPPTPTDMMSLVPA